LKPIYVIFLSQIRLKKQSIKKEQMIISTKLTSDIRLEEALKNADIQDPLTVTKLVISGLIKQKDFWYIRENMRGTLQELDMRNASISKNRIAEKAFEGCIGLTTVIIPDSVVELEASIFNFCSHLTSMTIGRGVTSIGKYMFGYCQSLTSVYILSSVTYIAEIGYILWGGVSKMCYL